MEMEFLNRWQEELLFVAVMLNTHTRCLALTFALCLLWIFFSAFGGQLIMAENLFHSVIYIHSPSSLCETKSFEDPPSAPFRSSGFCFTSDFCFMGIIMHSSVVEQWFLLVSDALCFHSNNKKENVPIQIMNHLCLHSPPPPHKQCHHPGVVCRSEHVLDVFLQRRR